MIAANRELWIHESPPADEHRPDVNVAPCPLEGRHPEQEIADRVRAAATCVRERIEAATCRTCGGAVKEVLL